MKSKKRLKPILVVIAFIIVGVIGVTLIPMYPMFSMKPTETGRIMDTQIIAIKDHISNLFL